MRTAVLLLAVVGLTHLAASAQLSGNTRWSQVQTRYEKSDPERVREIIERTVRSGQTVLFDGTIATTFVPPSNEDREEILAMGTHAVAALTNYANDPTKTFAQLIAVQLLADLGLPETFAALNRAVDPIMWEPVRLSALYGLAKLDRELTLQILQRMARDKDARVREAAEGVLQTSR